jgi:hypothetical protein
MIENKQLIRNRISKELKCSISEAKTIATSCLFGASMETTTSSGRQYKDSHYLQQLNMDLEEISMEIKGIKDSRTRTGDSVTTGIGSFGDSLAPEVWKRLGWSRKILAYMLQAEEVKVLESLIEAFEDDIIFIHHDSITTTRRMNPDELSRVVFEKTGYQLSFEEQVH